MSAAPEPLTRLLEDHPLPAADGDKNDRGTVVVVAGSPTCPGAAVLAAIAAVRAGAGRLQIVTAPELTVTMGVTVPEALVLGWRGGKPDDEVRPRLERADAVCIGPGLETDAPDLAREAARWIPPETPVLLDARAVPAAREYVADGRNFVLAPNPDEASELLDNGPDEGDVAAVAAALTGELRVPVAVRGDISVIAHGESAWCTEGATGLGTSGAGDVLAGIVAGLLCRGIEPHVALGWAVAAHGRAAELAGRNRRNPGFLARELLDFLPEAFASLP